MSRSPTSGAGAALVALARQSSPLRAAAAEALRGAALDGHSAAADALQVSRASIRALAALLDVELPPGAPGRRPKKKSTDPAT